MKLTAKERAFAAAYVKDPDKNASQAARDAGYADPRGAGCRALKRPGVRSLVASLEAAARKRIKARPKAVEVEVLPAPMPMGADVSANMVPTSRHEAGAIASRAEVLGMCTNLVRAHESRRLGDLYEVTPGGGMISKAHKLAELPLGMIQGVSHDHAGDIDLKLRDPLAAAKILLDDHYRERGDEDPMARPRQVVNVLMVQGTPEDRMAFDAMARRMAELGKNGGQGGDGNG